jgi:uncharacterized protein with PQ loop repeat
MKKIILRKNLLTNNSLIRFLEEKLINKKGNIFTLITSYGMDLSMICAPLIAYLFQINKFYKTKSSRGFSKYLCLLLFLGNIFRIFFWFGTRFKNVLLYQSIGIVIFQIILIHLCIKFQEKSYNSSRSYLPDIQLKIEKRSNINLVKNFIAEYYSKTFKPKQCQLFNPKLFWKWTKEIEYYKFMCVLTAFLSFLTFFLKKNKLFFQIIGVLCSIFEASVCFPQVIKNCKTKVTKNISFTMIFCWFLGDTFKLFYNIHYKAPIQLIMSISLQISLDFVVLCQIIMYRKNNFTEKNKINANKKQIEEINQLMKSIDEMNVQK